MIEKYLVTATAQGLANQAVESHVVLNLIAHINQLRVDVKRLQAEKESNVGLLSDLADMVSQHCTDNRDGTISTGGLSANEDAIVRLVGLGILEKISERPTRYKWSPPEDDAEGTL